MFVYLPKDNDNVLDGLFDAIFAPIDFIAPAIYFGLNGLTLPARIQAEIDQVHNDVLFNGGIDPNGYFNLNYMLTGYRPVPYGFDISQNSNFYAPGPRGGFVSADGTFHDNNDIARERMEYFQRHIEEKEEGDYNYMTSKEVLSMVGINQGIFTTGQDYVTDNPPAKGDKEGQIGDEITLYMVREISFQANLTFGVGGPSYGISIIEFEEGLAIFYNRGSSGGVDLPNLDVSITFHFSLKPFDKNTFKGAATEYEGSVFLGGASIGGNNGIDDFWNFGDSYISVGYGINFGFNDFFGGATIRKTYYGVELWSDFD